jgi:hypothetical protein
MGCKIEKRDETRCRHPCCNFAALTAKNVTEPAARLRFSTQGANFAQANHNNCAKTWCMMVWRRKSPDACGDLRLPRPIMPAEQGLRLSISVAVSRFAILRATSRTATPCLGLEGGFISTNFDSDVILHPDRTNRGCVEHDTQLASKRTQGLPHILPAHRTIITSAKRIPLGYPLATHCFQWARLCTNCQS